MDVWNTPTCVMSSFSTPNSLYLFIFISDVFLFSLCVFRFGGKGYCGYSVGPNNDASFDMMNDLWYYNVAANEWTWQDGSSDCGVVATTTQIGSRFGHAMIMDQAFTTIYIFGGFDNTRSHINDLYVLYRSYLAHLTYVTHI
jgi:hypothetical protein